MDYILTDISKLLNPSCKILLHSKLTQSFIDQSDTILWNELPLSIDDETYVEFKDALKKRGSKYYTRSDILSYCDFCIALLCSSGYSLNHTNTSLIESRTYTAAWRALNVMSSTGTDKVVLWINKYIADRTSEGYNTTFKISTGIENRRSSSMSSNTTIGNLLNEEVISSMSIREEVIKIPYYDDGCNVVGIFSSTFTPEGQLDNLRVVWSAEMNNIL